MGHYHVGLFIVAWAVTGFTSGLPDCMNKYQCFLFFVAFALCPLCFFDHTFALCLLCFFDHTNDGLA